MKKYLITILSAIIISLLVFSGCGANSDSNVCKNHEDTDGNGICDICGAELEVNKKTEFSVLFDTNHGIMQETTKKTVQKNSRLSLPNPKRTGYTFCGWFFGENKWTVYDRVNEDITLTAKWLSQKANSGKIYVSFDINDGSGTILKTAAAEQSGYIKTSDLPEQPTREGYYFAGWHTRREISQNDLVGGVSKYLYYSGASKSSVGGWNTEVESVFDPVCQIENVTANGAATLYARWVREKEVSSEKELNEIRNDLYGAYKLSSDILLTNEWQPIGSYYSNYELYETNWWVHAFRGYFDGNGHVVSGLKFTDVKSNDEEGLNLAVEEGKYGVAVTGLFGSIVDPAVVKNVTLRGAVVNQEFQSGCYIGTAIGFMQGGRVENVKSLDCDINVTATNSGSTSVTGLAGAFWIGTISDCKVTGNIKYTENRKTSDIGELFVGGISGECYSYVENCESECRIQVIVNDESEATQNGHLQVSVGGLCGANCYLTGSKGNSEISVAINGSKGKVTVRAGLAVGIERYGYIRNCEVRGSMTVDATDCTEKTSVHKGSILGGFDFSTYAMIGPIFGQGTRYIENNAIGIADLEIVGDRNYLSDTTFVYVIENNTVSSD